MSRDEFLEHLIFEINDSGIGPAFTSHFTPDRGDVMEFLYEDELRVLQNFTSAYRELNELAEKLAKEVGEELYGE